MVSRGADTICRHLSPKPCHALHPQHRALQPHTSPSPIAHTVEGTVMCMVHGISPAGHNKERNSTSFIYKCHCMCRIKQQAVGTIDNAQRGITRLPRPFPPSKDLTTAKGFKSSMAIAEWANSYIRQWDSMP